MSISTVTDDDKLFTTELFHKIKPLCIRLSQLSFQQQLTHQDSSELFECLTKINKCISDAIVQYTQQNSGLNPHISSSLGDYVFVPVAQLFKQSNLNDKVIYGLLDLLSLLIKYCWTNYGAIPPKLAKQLFPLIVFLIGGSPNLSAADIPNKSIELKTAGVACLSSLFRSLISQREFFQSIEMLPPLGHCITVLLSSCISTDNEEIELSIAAISTLRILYFQLINDPEILCHILPGNVSRISNILSMKQNMKPNFQVVIDLLSLLGDLLTLVFNDFSLNIQESHIESLEKLSTNEQITDLIKIPVSSIKSTKSHRTNSWLRATSNQVKIFLNNFLSSLKKHHKFQVKFELLAFMGQILDKSYLSLNLLIPNFIDIISFIATDPANQYNENLKAKCDSMLIKPISNKKNLVKVLKNKLDEYVTLISTVLNSTDDDKICGLLNSINFNLSILKKLTGDEDIESIENIEKTVVSNLRNELCIIMQRQTKIKKQSKDTSYQSDLMILSANYGNEVEVVNKEKLLFLTGLYSLKAENSMNQLIKSLGSGKDSVDSSAEIIDYLLLDDEDYEGGDDPEHRIIFKSVSLWLSHNLLESVSSKYNNDSRSLNRIPNEMDKYLTFNDSDDGDDISDVIDIRDSEYRVIENSCYNILEFSKELLDEVLALGQGRNKTLINAQFISIRSINSVVGAMKSNFKDELIDYLYPIIDSLASPFNEMKGIAQLTALSIAEHCYNGSITDLISHNSDYLVDALSLRLTGSAITPRTSSILLVLIKIGKLDLIEKLDDVINSMFILLDLYHGYSSLCEGFFIVFEEIINQVYDSYLKDFDIKIELTNSLKPWGIRNRADFLKLVDRNEKQVDSLEEFDSEKEYFKHPNKPFGDSENINEDFENEGEPDSDDENISEEEPKENEIWESPVPKGLFLLIQRIYNYGIRLLSHPSLKLKVQIMKTNSKIIAILASFPKYLYPTLASSWPSILYLCGDSDPRLISPANEMAYLMIKYGASFMNSRFIELWDYLQKHSTILISFKKLSDASYSVSSTKSKSNQVALPTVNLKIYKSFVDLIMIGLGNCGRSISDVAIHEMIKFSLPIVKDISEFGIHSDVAWLIKSVNAYKNGSFEETVPDNVTGKFKSYTFKKSIFV